MDRKRGQLVYVIIALLLCFVRAGVFAIVITVTGSWSETINENDLQGGPGTDLVSTYESATNEVVIDIDDTSSTWKVEHKRTDSTWHANFTLSEKRTSDGSGPGSVSGGTSYSTIGTTDTQFFTGSDTRSNIDVQLQLEGVSVQIPPDTYSTTVTYTVIESGGGG